MSSSGTHDFGLMDLTFPGKVLHSHSTYTWQRHASFSTSVCVHRITLL